MFRTCSSNVMRNFDNVHVSFIKVNKKFVLILPRTRKVTVRKQFILRISSTIALSFVVTLQLGPWLWTMYAISSLNVPIAQPAITADKSFSATARLLLLSREFSNTNELQSHNVEKTPSFSSLKTVWQSNTFAVGEKPKVMITFRCSVTSMTVFATCLSKSSSV